MKTLTLILAALILAGGAAAQHAPSLEQCHKSADLWAHDSLAAESQMPVKTLQQRMEVLHECFDADRDKAWESDYALEGEQIENRIIERLHHYLVRHSLSDNFLDEDVEGKR
jgi:hypothetical protein